MWYYDGKSSEECILLETMIREHVKNAKLARAISRYWELYNYLEENKPKSAEELRKTVMLDRSTPFFSEDISEKVFYMLPIVKDPNMYGVYIRDLIQGAHSRKKQKGGQKIPNSSDTQVFDDFIDWVILFVGARAANAGFDSKQPTVFGKVAMGVGMIQYVLTLPVTILQWIIKNPYLGGPIWLAAINIFLDILPKINIAQNIIITAISTPLMVIGVGFIVQFIGILIGFTIGMIAFTLSLAVGRKGQAFLNFIGLIPVIGPILRFIMTNIIQTVNVINKQRKVLGALPVVGRFIYTEPSKQIQDGQPGTTTTGKGRTRRRNRVGSKPPKMGRVGRRSTSDW